MTGDWWGVGPVTITQLTPAPAAGRNGSVVDPPAGKRQGYDDRIAGCAAWLRAVYDYKFVGGTGGHSGKHGGAILPDSLRWLWRPAQPNPSAK